VFVIQSLGDSELHTGNRIKEDLDTYNSAFPHGVTIELIDVVSKNEFFDILKEIESFSKKEVCSPVLHIEAHGTSDHQGMVFKNGDYCSWSDVKQYFISINKATRLNLLIVFSLCYGAHFSEHLVLTDRAPCWGLVGPTKAVEGSYLLESFSSFYREIFQAGDGNKAVRELNKRASVNDIDYYFTTATMFFKDVYKEYIKTRCTERIYQERASKLRKRLKKDRVPKIPSIGSLKRQYKSSERKNFENFRYNFFMIDLFPENAARFKVEYSQIAKKLL
jgi:hypothetical protein